MENNEKLCPITRDICIEEECGWWCDNNDQCAMAALANGIVYEIDHLNEGIARENTREKAEIIAKNAYMRALISRDRACGKCLDFKGSRVREMPLSYNPYAGTHAHVTRVRGTGLACCPVSPNPV